MGQPTHNNANLRVPDHLPACGRLDCSSESVKLSYYYLVSTSVARTANRAAQYVLPMFAEIWRDVQ